MDKTYVTDDLNPPYRNVQWKTRLGSLSLTFSPSKSKHYCWSDMMTERAKEGRNWNVTITVKVGVNATCQHFKPWRWRTRPNRRIHTELCHMNSDTLQRARHNAEPDCAIQLKCGEVGTHESWKTARTRESFDHQGTIRLSFFQTNYD